MQRYMPHFPAAGEIVIFDRSWYNRAGVEHVMGFCTEEQYKRSSSTARSRDSTIATAAFADQVLARGQRRGAEAAVRGADRRPVRSGSSVTWTCRPGRSVRVLARARRMFKATDPRSAAVHIVAPTTESAQSELHRAPAVADSVQEGRSSEV
jgi:hypothetical protein